jgi:GT2 family glycosyltransferase
VVVVDNGSTDGSPERIGERFPEARIMSLGKNQGLPRARNVGLEALGTELVLFVDYDVYLQPDCLGKLVTALEEEAAALACPQVRLHPERDTVQAAGSQVHFLGTMVLGHGYRTLNAVPTGRELVDGCIGACMLVRRTTALEAGGFDELYFLYFEDMEFGLRLRSFGNSLVCDHRAVAFHDRGEATPEVSFRGKGTYPPRRAYITMRNRLLTIFVHFRIRTLIVLSPVLVLFEASTLGVALFRGWLKHWFKGVGWLFRNRVLIRERRRRVQGTRTVADRDILVGGDIPLTPGFLRSGPARLGAKALSSIFNGYWFFARRWIG